jgi:hypothetical protein
MAKGIQISKQTTIWDPALLSYKLVVSVIGAQGMPEKIFVKQRIRNFSKQKFDDTFVAVATPSQLEDFHEDAPAEGSSYFRTNQIELVARTPEAISNIFESLLYEIKKLTRDLSDIELLSEAVVYNISDTGDITVSL